MLDSVLRFEYSRAISDARQYKNEVIWFVRRKKRNGKFQMDDVFLHFIRTGTGSVSRNNQSTDE